VYCAGTVMSPGTDTRVKPLPLMRLTYHRVMKTDREGVSTGPFWTLPVTLLREVGLRACSLTCRHMHALA
jgi:hypothetical protein